MASQVVYAIDVLGQMIGNSKPPSGGLAVPAARSLAAVAELEQAPHPPPLPPAPLPPDASLSVGSYMDKMGMASQSLGESLE